MNFPRLRICLALTLGGLATYGDGPDDQYVRIYDLIQEADSLVASGQRSLGRDKYLEAQSALQDLHKANPAWNEPVVQFRLKYISEKLQPSASPAAAGATVLSPGAGANVVTELQDQIRQLTMDKELLQARLKEAFAAQPASADPREMARSGEVIKDLQKEVEVLKVRLAQAEAKPDKPVAPALFQEAQNALAEARRKVFEQGEMIGSLNLEKQALQGQLLSTAQADQLKSLGEENASLKQQVGQFKKGAASAAAAEMLARQFGSLQKELTAQQSRNDALIAEKGILEERLERLEKRREAELAEEKKGLERELANAKTAAQASDAAASGLRESLRSTQGAAARLEHEKREIETQLSAARSAVASAKLAVLNGEIAAQSNAEEIKRLKRERDESNAELSVASEELRDARTRLLQLEPASSGGSSKDLNVALVSGGRLSEKKLSGAPNAGLASATNMNRDVPDRRSAAVKAVNPESGQMAEQSAVNLAHLAAIQMDQNRLADAESTLKSALAKDPTNTMSLLLLGELRVRQCDFEAALLPLSQAAQQDPQNAEAHNYLGLTLMEKGLRDPAEFAMLRAVRLSPHFGDAHYNLAVFYMRQRPPAYELARQQYEEALAAGHSNDADLEKLLRQRAADSIAK